jgi:hypothetical protein
MPVIEAQCASILVPHDHRHINHVSEVPLLMQGSGVFRECRFLNGPGLAPPAPADRCSVESAHRSAGSSRRRLLLAAGAAVTGRYLPFGEPRPTTVGAAVDGLQHVYDASGKIEFELDGQPLSRTAFPGQDPGPFPVRIRAA